MIDRSTINLILLVKEYVYLSPVLIHHLPLPPPVPDSIRLACALRELAAPGRATPGRLFSGEQ